MLGIRHCLCKESDLLALVEIDIVQEHGYIYLKILVVSCNVQAEFILFL